MGLCCVGFGIAEAAHSSRQSDRVDIDPRRSTVGFGYKNDVQSLSCLSSIEVDLGQFLFFLGVFLAINLRVSRERHRLDSKLDCAIERHVVDCFLSAWRVHVKVSLHETEVVIACFLIITLLKTSLSARPHASQVWGAEVASPEVAEVVAVFFAAWAAST